MREVGGRNSKWSKCCAAWTRTIQIRTPTQSGRLLTARTPEIGGAHKILMDLCQADLRCLDAHAHLGNLVFDTRPEDAIRHYEVGFRIGKLSLGKGFDVVLPWRCIDNRPFLRSMHGYGLCLWRLERFQDARNIFDRMLWLNPSDNQGVRFLSGDVAASVAWEDSENR